MPLPWGIGERALPATLRWGELGQIYTCGAPPEAVEGKAFVLMPLAISELAIEISAIVLWVWPFCCLHQLELCGLFSSGGYLTFAVLMSERRRSGDGPIGSSGGGFAITLRACSTETQ